MPTTCASGLREIDNVRPALMVPVWINDLLKRTCPDPLAKAIKKVWDELADEFRAIEFVRNHHTTFHLYDDASKLEWTLKFSRGVSLANLSNLREWIEKRLFIREGGFYRNAFTEPEFKNRKARFVVYGHTHQYEIVPLDTVDMPAGTPDQIYINSGTWRAVNE